MAHTCDRSDVPFKYRSNICNTATSVVRWEAQELSGPQPKWTRCPRGIRELAFIKPHSNRYAGSDVLFSLVCLTALETVSTIIIHTTAPRAIRPSSPNISYPSTARFHILSTGQLAEGQQKYWETEAALRNVTEGQSARSLPVLLLEAEQPHRLQATLSTSTQSSLPSLY